MRLSVGRTSNEGGFGCATCAGAASCAGWRHSAPSTAFRRRPCAPRRRALVQRPRRRLPARGEFVIRNGFVLTMDAALGDIPGGSVHVRNGEIVAVGRGGERAGRGDHRRDRHDRAAGADRNALAHVEHAVPQLRRRRAGARLFPDGRALRRGDDARRHVPGRAPLRRRGDPFGHDHGARLVSQHPQPRIRRARHPGAQGHRHPRALLLRLVAGPGRQGHSSTCATSRRSTATGRAIPTTA